MPDASSLHLSLRTQVRYVDAQAIQDQLSLNNVVILSNLGYTPSGDVLNCHTFEVATRAAIQLKADKVSVNEDEETTEPIRSLRTTVYRQGSAAWCQKVHSIVAMAAKLPHLAFYFTGGVHPQRGERFGGVGAVPRPAGVVAAQRRAPDDGASAAAHPILRRRTPVQVQGANGRRTMPLPVAAAWIVLTVRLACAWGGRTT